MSPKPNRNTPFKIILKIILTVTVVYGLYVTINFGIGFYELAQFYKPEKITENFRTTSTKFPHRIIKTAEPWHFKRAAEGVFVLPKTYLYKGQELAFDELLEKSGTTGLLVMHGDTILYENYFQGEQDSDRHSMFSVTKSFVSALFGLALEDGLIKSIDDPITAYLPELNGSGYEGVKIRDILTMSSGVRFTEDYGDLLSDVNRMSMTIASKGSLDAFAASLSREREPGTYNNYVSVDTHVLGMLITRVSGRTLSDLLTEKIWQPIGMEFDGVWVMDGEGMEVAMGGMQVALRDMARFGRLYLYEGTWNGKQIVPAGWVKASITPSAPHLMPGADNPASATPYGYGFQWWVPETPHGDFMAAGIYDQFIYIDPTSDVVIVKTSANTKYVDPTVPLTKNATIHAFQQISASIAAQLRTEDIAGK